MKKMVVIAALALLAATPALAKSRQHVAPTNATAQSTNVLNAYGSAGDPFAVMSGKRLVGRDPDAAIRLRIEQQSQTGNFSK